MMRLVLSAVGLVLALVGFVVFVALAGGVWVAKRDADRRVARLADKAGAATTAAGQGVQLVKDVIAGADEGLTQARAEAQSQGQPARTNPALGLVRWQFSRELPGRIDQARDVVQVASEAIVVADAALSVLADHPDTDSRLGLRVQQLGSTQNQLASLSSDLRNVRALLGPAADQPAYSADQLDRVGRVLTQARQLADDMDQVVTEARDGVAAARTTATMWTLRIAIVVSALSALAALGQVFLARACWRGLFHTV